MRDLTIIALCCLAYLSIGGVIQLDQRLYGLEKRVLEIEMQQIYMEIDQ